MEKSERQSAFVIAFLVSLVVSFAFDGWQFVRVWTGEQTLASATMR